VGEKTVLASPSGSRWDHRDVNATTEHAPADAWGPDFLGPGFEARTLELLPDDEDDGAVATLVRHLPALDPSALPGTPSSPSFSAGMKALLPLAFTPSGYRII